MRQADWIPTILHLSPTTDARCESYLIWSLSLRVLAAPQKGASKLVWSDPFTPTQGCEMLTEILKGHPEFTIVFHLDIQFLTFGFAQFLPLF